MAKSNNIFAMICLNILCVVHTAHTVFAIFISSSSCIHFVVGFLSTLLHCIHAFTYLWGVFIVVLYWLHSCYRWVRRSEEANLKGWWQTAAAAYTNKHTFTCLCAQKKSHTKQHQMIHIRLMFQSTSDQFAKSISVMWQLPKCSGLFEISIVLVDHCEKKK